MPKQEMVNKAHYMKQLGESHSTIRKKLKLTQNQLSYILYQKEPSPKENIVAIAPTPRRDKEIEAAYKQASEAVSFANATIRRVKKILGMKA